MARSAEGTRWEEILRAIRPDLPGEWSTRGGGMKAILVREPIGWAIPWIGCSKASSARTHAGVAPALWDRLDWLMGIYGLDMADVPAVRVPSSSVRTATWTWRGASSVTLSSGSRS